PSSGPPESRATRTAPPLPPIPLVEGPLNPKVVFPERNQAITVRDSNFVFGSVGNGHAKLTINGTPVPVAPNGTFLAYLPVPPATAPRYELVAYAGGAAEIGRQRARQAHDQWDPGTRRPEWDLPRVPACSAGDRPTLRAGRVCRRGRRDR